MLRLGWFSTGRGPGSRNLLKAVMDGKERGELDVEIAFVFCNWDNDEEDNPKREQRQMFFDMVRGYGIPLVTASWKKFEPELWKTDQVRWRDEYGKLLRERISPYPFDLGILAGYMLWMDDETCRTYDILNLHPALPDGPYRPGLLDVEGKGAYSPDLPPNSMRYALMKASILPSITPPTSLVW